MPNEPEPKPTGKKIPRLKLVDDGFVVYEVDCSVPNDPTQPKWPVVIQPPGHAQSPAANRPVPPDAGGAPGPK